MKIKIESDAKVPNENDVIVAVCKFLVDHDYLVESSSDTKSHGDDINAYSKKDRSLRLIIEAKGATSSKVGTTRYGLPFNRSQVNTHIAVALLRGARYFSKNDTAEALRFALALPENDAHIAVIDATKKALDVLEIGMFWVNESLDVRFEATWSL